MNQNQNMLNSYYGNAYVVVLELDLWTSRYMSVAVVAFRLSQRFPRYTTAITTRPTVLMGNISRQPAVRARAVIIAVAPPQIDYLTAWDH